MRFNPFSRGSYSSQLARFSLALVVLALSLTGSLLFAAAPGDVIAFEAETMTADAGAWEVKEHYLNWYGGIPLGYKMLNGARGTAGRAVKELTVPDGGRYRLWVRYLDILRQRGEFRVTIMQEGRVVADKVFDSASLRANREGAARWGAGFGQFVWDCLEAELSAGSCMIVLAKEGAAQSYLHTRNIDFFFLTRDLEYAPRVEDFYPPLYARVVMDDDHPIPCAIHIWGRRPTSFRGQVFTGHHNVTRKGLLEGVWSNVKSEDFLRAGDKSPWFSLAPMINLLGDNRIQFDARVQYRDGYVPGAAFTVQFSRSPSEDGIMKSFSRSGSGAGLIVVFDLSKPDEMRSEVEWSRICRNLVERLPDFPGRRPVKFPVHTGCEVDAAISPEERVENDLRIMKLLGFSALNRTFARNPDRRAQEGFGATDSPIYFYLAGPEGRNRGDANALCLNQPRSEDIRRLLQNTYNSLLEETGGSPPVYLKLMDEPSSVTMKHIQSCAACREKFRDYCRAAGLSAETLGVNNWQEVKPVEDGSANSQLYYHTVDFRNRSMTDFFGLGTGFLREIDPDIRTMVNPSNESLYNMLARGYDFYDLIRRNALTFGWAEDWNNLAATYQVSGYAMALLRSACRTRNRPYGVYSILSNRSPWDIQTKAFSQVGQGARAISFFNWGPHYSLSSDANSRRIDIYPALKQFNHALGAVEETVQQAEPAASGIALLYSHSTDTWELNSGWGNIFTAERIGLDLLLRHLGHQPEVIDEQGVIEGITRNYRVVFLAASHLRPGVMSALLDWTAKGGLLYVSAGSAMYDHYNHPVDGLATAGIRRDALVSAQPPGRPRFDYRNLKTLGDISADGLKMESFCASQRLKSDGGTVHARWSDGNAAVCEVAHGQGRVIFSGFLPGIAYYRGGAIAKHERDSALEKSQSPDSLEQDGIPTGEGYLPAESTYNAPGYPQVYRDFIRSLLAVSGGETPPVRTSEYLVEAMLLTGEAGSVIALANWSGRSLNVDIEAELPAATGIPEAVIHPLENVERRGRTVSFRVMNLGPGDFISIPSGK